MLGIKTLPGFGIKAFKKLQGIDNCRSDTGGRQALTKILGWKFLGVDKNQGQRLRAPGRSGNNYIAKTFSVNRFLKSWRFDRGYPPDAHQRYA